MAHASSQVKLKGLAGAGVRAFVDLSEPGLPLEPYRQLLDGLIPIPELKDGLELKYVPEEENGRYHTLGGLGLRDHPLGKDSIHPCAL